MLGLRGNSGHGGNKLEVRIITSDIPWWPLCDFTIVEPQTLLHSCAMVYSLALVGTKDEKLTIMTPKAHSNYSGPYIN